MYAERAEHYARDVVAGRILACALVKKACQRHLDDLEKQENEAFPYRFDPVSANKVCGFVELLPHVKGKWAAKHELIRLEAWQCFVIAVPFGWLKKSNGKRRFRRVYVEVPRKNAKSTITAALGLYMLTEDGEAGAEVYSGASSEVQAWEVFGPALKMATATLPLRSHYGVHVGAKSLSVASTGSRFQPMIGNPGDGSSPSFAIIDEYHEHPTESQHDTMITGMGSREQPIAWVITTAGTSIEGPCYALHSEVEAVLNGTVTNDTLFGIIYTVDLGVDWTSDIALRMANPNYGISIEDGFLEDEQRTAINNPRKQSTFKTKHLNVWTTAASPFFNLEKWNRLADPSLKVADFAGESCWMALDLASKLDLCADMKVFKRDLEGVPHFYAFGRFYLPQERADDPATKYYAEWVAKKHLIATAGNITDYDEIEANISQDSETFRVVKLGYDPYNATQMTTHFSNMGIDLMEVPQTVKHLSDPMKWTQALIEDGRLHHDGNPVFAWGISNVTAQEDRNGNVFPRKEHPARKIDPAVALIMAIGFAQSGDGGSIYETQGIDYIEA